MTGERDCGMGDACAFPDEQGHEEIPVTDDLAARRDQHANDGVVYEWAAVDAIRREYAAEQLRAAAKGLRSGGYEPARNGYPHFDCEDNGRRAPRRARRRHRGRTMTAPWRASVKREEGWWVVRLQAFGVTVKTARFGGYDSALYFALRNVGFKW